MGKFFKFIAVVAAMGLVAWMFLAMNDHDWRSFRNLGEARNSLDLNGREKVVPYPPKADGRLLPLVTATTSGEHSFIDNWGGEPVLFDPCRPVNWVYNPAGAPANLEALIHESVLEIQQATGLQFNYEGYTDEAIDFDRDPIQDRYGKRYAPSILGWASEASIPELTGSVAGIASPFTVPAAQGADRFLAAGVVVFDAEDIDEILKSSSGEDAVRAVVLHELAHLVGLDHVSDMNELMYFTTGTRYTFGDGDREGLALAGAGKCERNY